MPTFDPKKYAGRRLSDTMKSALEAVTEGKSSLAEARGIFQLCVNQKIDPYTRGKIRQRLWEVEKSLGLHPLYYSQAGQDKFIFERFFTQKSDGVFVEIGGYNGVNGSNCLFFAKFRNWCGLILEPSPELAQNISHNRDAEVVQAAISNSDGTADFIDITSGFTQMSGLADDYNSAMLEKVRSNPNHREKKLQVLTMRLDSLLNKYNIDQVDYCSIDVEGGESSILSSFDFNAFDISVLSIENNTGNDSGSVREILGPAGYRVVDIIGVDEIYAR